MYSLKYLRASASRTRLRQPLVWLRNLGLDPADQFLASYPRSGNTMLRFLLAEAITGLPSTFDTMQRTIPEIGVHLRATPLLPHGGRLIKTHEPLRPAYHRAIYVIRDVRDVLLSNFGRETAMDAIPSRGLDDFTRLFMQGKMTRWGAWQDHLAQWLDSPLARRGDLHVVRFEEMRKNPHAIIAGALEFLGLETSPEAIERAIANNSLERMRDKEDMAAALPKTNEVRGRWIGQGSVNGWRQRLTPAQLEAVDKYAGKMLDRLGYGAYASLSQSSATTSGQLPVPDHRKEPAIEPIATSRLRSQATGSGGLLTSESKKTREQSMERTSFQSIRRQIGGRTAAAFCWYLH